MYTVLLKWVPMLRYIHLCDFKWLDKFDQRKKNNLYHWYKRFAPIFLLPQQRLFLYWFDFDTNLEKIKIRLNVNGRWNHTYRTKESNLYAQCIHHWLRAFHLTLCWRAHRNYSKTQCDSRCKSLHLTLAT